MKTNKILAAALLALLAAGCGKDSGRLRIYAETMTSGHAAKVWVNPANPGESATWVENELIDLNGNAYPIADDDGYYINTGEAVLPDNLYAIYPATTTTGGNDITVTNNGASESTVLIRRLTANYRDGGHDIIFPMATGRVANGSEQLLFKHLTGGMKLTLTDTSSANDYTIGAVKIIVYGDEATPGAMTVHNVTTRWEQQGPVLPSGEIGAIEDDQSVIFASEMHFALQTNGVAGKALGHNGSISLCVPVTLTPVKRLVVTGYDTYGAQLFVRSKELSPALDIEANTMYTIPTISF